MGGKDEKRRKARLQRLADAGRELIPSREVELGRKVAQKVAHAATWPMVGTWMRPGWESDQLAVIYVARRRPDGAIAGASLMVDLGCQGIKFSDVRTSLSDNEWLEWLDRGGGMETPPASCPPTLAASVVAAAVRWAERWGFATSPMGRAAALLLAGIEPAQIDEIVVGVEGKPSYVSGPYDDSDAILARLEKAAGPGGYHYTVGSDPEAALLDDDPRD